MAYGTATLTGTYKTFDNQPAEGVVEIIPNSRSLVDAEGDVILAGRVKVTLDATGSFSVALPATDDATVEPATGRQYTVVAKLRHTHLPAVTGVELATGATVDVADVASAPVVDPAVTTAATTAQVAALESGLAEAALRATDLHASPQASYPTFTKFTANPVVSDAAWPWVLRVDTLLDTPLDTYYMWTSTDHNEGPGGIRLRTAPAPEGPWTDRGQVYVDTVTGDQTEQPSVVWNEATSLFHLFYQQRHFPTTGRQSILLATSPDGVNWTRVGAAIVAPNQTEVFGSGTTGYFRPFRVGARWYGYHIYGDGDFYRMGISYSSDGITWEISRNQLGTGVAFTDAARREVQWNQVSHFTWNGQPWAIFIWGQRVSGTTVGDNRIGLAPLSSDFRRLAAPPILVLPSGQPWETTNLRAVYAFVDENRLHVYYQADSAIGYATGA